MGKPFRILSIDGGGIRGVYPAHILRCIEERLKINLFETFDMIAGTSTGSIIAAGIAVGIPAVDIENLYMKHGAKIFDRKGSWWLSKKFKSLFSPIIDSIYHNGHLKTVLAEIFQERMLDEIEKPLLIPSTDIGNGCVHVLKSGYSEKFNRDNKVLVRDAILASCSAPTYFDPHRIESYLLSDGGLWANNPALAAAIDAQHRLGVEQSDIRILTIGTGHSRTTYGNSISRKWGIINGWRGKELISFILSLQSQSAMNYLKLQLRAEQILRINFESELPLTLDDASQIDELVTRADHDFTHESETIMSFVRNKC